MKHNKFQKISIDEYYTSHVVAPKWMPDDAAWQTAQGIPLKISSIFGFGFWSIEMKRKFSVFDHLWIVFVPVKFIPTVTHFSYRQYWHCVRVVRVIKQFFSRIHLYFKCSPWTDRRKNFLQASLEKKTQQKFEFISSIEWFSIFHQVIEPQCQPLAFSPQTWHGSERKSCR